jgi:hypothetical protein
MQAPPTIPSTQINFPRKMKTLMNPMKIRTTKTTAFWMVCARLILCAFRRLSIACATSHPRLALADVSELTENEDEFIKGKLYGNFCGVRYLIHCLFRIFVIAAHRCVSLLCLLDASQNPDL